MTQLPFILHPDHAEYLRDEYGYDVDGMADVGTLLIQPMLPPFHGPSVASFIHATTPVPAEYDRLRELFAPPDPKAYELWYRDTVTSSATLPDMDEGYTVLVHKERALEFGWIEHFRFIQSPELMGAEVIPQQSAGRKVSRHHNKKPYRKEASRAKAKAARAARKKTRK